MNIITKHPVNNLGYGFINPKYLPKGKDENYLRNLQNKNEISYRELSSAEKKILIKNGNSSDDWNKIFVSNTFDPDLVKMQFQTEVINLGYKAADYFKKYPGRFISSHLSDWTADKKEVPVGQGVIDWKEFFAAAKTGGVKSILVPDGQLELPFG